MVNDLPPDPDRTPVDHAAESDPDDAELDRLTGQAEREGADATGLREAVESADAHLAAARDGADEVDQQIQQVRRAVDLDPPTD